MKRPSRYSCVRCGSPAIYLDAKGRRKGRKDHDLCERCMKAAIREGAQRALSLPPFGEAQA